MKPAPSDWPRVSSSIFYQDAARAIDWLCEAFGFEVRLKVEGDGGRIEHSELTYGEGLLMISQEDPDSPRALEAHDAQSAFARRRSHPEHHVFSSTMRRRIADTPGPAGAVIVEEPATHDYGEAYWADRSYGALDLEGHLWWITQRLRNSPGA